MKRLSLVLLVVLLALGSVSVFADAHLTPTIKGDATATVGYDLENGSFGMVNSTTSNIKLDIVPKSTAATGVESGWFGWVELKDFRIGFDYGDGKKFVTEVVTDDSGFVDDDGDTLYYVSEVKTETSGLIVTPPSVTARIVSGPMYFQIWALDEFKTGKVSVIENDEDDDIPVMGDETGLATELGKGSGGFTFAYAQDMFGVKLHMATETGYDGTDPDDNANFLVGADLTLNLAPADVQLEVVRGINVKETLGLGLGVTLDLGIGSLFLGMDGELPDGGDFAWEVGSSLTAGFGDIDLGLDLVYSEALNLDAELTAKASLGDLTAGLLFGGYNVDTDDLEWRVVADASYKITEQVTGSVATGFDSLGNFPLTVKAEAKLIPQTTFTLQYKSGTSLIDATAGGGSAADLGDVTFATKISY